MRRRIATWLFCVCAAHAPLAGAAYSDFYFFGDSLSDPGNNRIAFDSQGIFDVTPVPIAGNFFVPTFPYASTRYTDDKVWAQSFAAAFGLAASPSLVGGTNFAFGGASTGPEMSVFPYSLRTQVSGLFLPSVGGHAPGDALYVIAGGGNNARDAVNQVAGGADPATTLFNTALGFAIDVAAMIVNLRQAGADEFIVWTAPDAGKAPAILFADAIVPGTAAYATQLSMAMNSALIATITGIPGLDDGVRFFDLFGLQNQVISNPAAYGLTNVTDACAADPACNPSQYLFWDGIHPTSGGHAIIAREMIALVPEPSTYAMLLVGLAGLVLVVRRRAARG